MTEGEHRVLWANEPFRALCEGTPSESLKGAQLSQVMRSYASVRWALQEASGGNGRRVHTEVRAEAADGQRWQLEVVESGPGELLLEAHTPSYPGDQERRDRRGRQLLSWMNHELRNPLNPISLTAAMLLYDDSLAAPVRAGLEVIERNAREETALLTDSMELCRIAWGLVELPATEVDAAGLMSDAVERLRPELERAGIGLIFQPGGGRYPMRADPARLSASMEAILLVLGRAVSPGGTMQVMAARTGAPSWEVALEADRLDTDTISALALPWEQLGRQKDVLQKALALACLELHGGQLRAQCGPTSASVVVSFEPAPGRLSEVPPSSRRGPAMVLADGPVPPRMRILVVEDDPASRLILQRLLERDGHEVRVAESIAEALERLHAGELDVVITDLGLPDGDGRSLLKRLRRESRVKVIALTGEEQGQERGDGFDLYLIKPVNAGQLRRAIAEAHQMIARDAEADRSG